MFVMIYHIMRLTLKHFNTRVILNSNASVIFTATKKYKIYSMIQYKIHETHRERINRIFTESKLNSSCSMQYVFKFPFISHANKN